MLTYKYTQIYLNIQTQSYINTYTTYHYIIRFSSFLGRSKYFLCFIESFPGHIIICWVIIYDCFLLKRCILLYVNLCVCLCVSCVCVWGGMPSKVRRRCLSPGSWSSRTLWAVWQGRSNPNFGPLKEQ